MQYFSTIFIHTRLARLLAASLLGLAPTFVLAEPPSQCRPGDKEIEQIKLGKHLFDKKDLVGADAAWAKAIDAARSAADCNLVEVSWQIGDFAKKRDDLVRAKRYLGIGRDAYKLKKSPEDFSYGKLQKSLGNVAKRDANEAQACTHLKAALQIFTSINAPRQIKEVTAEMGEFNCI
ncbi:hypothetical protein HZU83_13575 [Sphaerotilus montanus]|uniref:Tetratricopeptide repeat protein n=1 Tax=Sphaerotilus montanus TaxID=522889 RepID=A0A7Y9QXU1_9BURK|nr:hypothetical protein [Sphaerotilus montanus]NYG32911.1 hypothetical protein [Sphaerotilus montanus]NZD57720.1 hypothetical protein [Sphaerotilus montanus]